MKIIARFISFNKMACGIIERRLAIRNYKTVLLETIERRLLCKDSPVVLEAGGIDRPLMSKRPGIRFEGLDIEFRSGCEKIYDDFTMQSIEAPLPRKYDLIFSVTLLEHVPDNKASISAIYGSLNYRGATMHYVPSRHHPYSLILKLVGPSLQKKIIQHLRPEVENIAGYPAYFNLCSPKEMKWVFEEQGFRNVRVDSFYYAADYFNFFFPLYVLVALWEIICRRLGLMKFCSGFIITAEKPD